MDWTNLFMPSRKIKELEKEIEILKTELDKRQEAINKTNAYYKKKMGEQQKRQKL